MTMLQLIRVLTVCSQIPPPPPKKKCQWPVSGNPLLCAMNRTLKSDIMTFILHRVKNENSLIWNMCFSTHARDL